MKKHLIIIVLLLSSCASENSSRTKDLSVGMKEQEVRAILGKPTSKSANGKVEYLNYSLFESVWDRKGTPYFVRMVEGRVDAFGRTGDFDSTKDPTLNINIKQK